MFIVFIGDIIYEQGIYYVKKLKTALLRQGYEGHPSLFSIHLFLDYQVNPLKKTGPPSEALAKDGGDAGTRTPDLRIMIPPL